MIFRQLFEPLSSTYTYLLASEETGRAILIDPVISVMGRDLELLRKLGLTLAYTVDTHVHADHITAALELKKKASSRIAVPANEHVPCADVQLEEGKPFQLDDISSILCIRLDIPPGILPTRWASACSPAMHC